MNHSCVLAQIMSPDPPADGMHTCLYVHVHVHVCVCTYFCYVTLPHTCAHIHVYKCTSLAKLLVGSQEW